MRSIFQKGLVALLVASVLVCAAVSNAAEVRQETVREIVRQLSAKVPWTGKKRVGVSPFTSLATEKVTVLGKRLAKELISALSDSRKFHVVTLDIERLAKVLKDELPDLKAPDTRVEIGRIFGIQVVLTGSHYSGWRGRTVYAELTDLERGTVWGAIVREFSPAWWVWMLFGLVIVGLALGGVRYRGRRQKLHNRQADAHYAEAMKHYAAGNLEEARAKGRDALDQNPNHFEASVLIEKIDAALNRPVEPPPEEPGEEETAEDEETVADPPPPPSPPPLTFHVRVWTDNADNPLKQDRLRTRDIKVLPSREESRYKLGDRIIIHFASDRDCHLRLVNIGPTGNVKQLFPNDWHPDNFIRAGEISSLPGPEYSGFDFRLGPPAGLETVKAIASTEPFDLADLEKDGPFARIRTRDIEVIPAEGSNPNALRAEDFCRFFVAE